jgi:integrase
MALTDVKIRSAKPKAAVYRLADAGGLYLLISPSGGKLWRWNYRYGGKQKTMPLGKYPDISLADVRSAHQIARTELAKGNDPMAQRKAEKALVTVQIENEKAGDANSLEAIALKWHDWWSPSVEADTAAYILRRLKSDVFPVLGQKPINDVKPTDIRQLIISIEQGTTAARRFKGKGARDVAQRQHSTLSQIYRYALANELAEVNPAAAFKQSDVLSTRKPQNRAHIEPHQLPALLAAMEDFNGHKVVKLAVKLMALTFVRTQELLCAPWAEFNTEHALWKIDAARMKKEKPHLVPLSRQAVAILRQLKQMAGEHLFVFPGLNAQTANGTINLNSILNALEDMGYKTVMTGHGYRGLARTILADNGWQKPHVEIQLAHANDDKTEAAYNHALYLPQRIDMMQWWADFLDTEFSREKTRVLALRKTA